MLKDVKHFDAQNPVIGSLIREVDIRKKKIRVNFWINHLTSGTWKLGLHMKKLREKAGFFNRNDNNNNNNSFFTPPLPPP